MVNLEMKVRKPNLAKIEFWWLIGFESMTCAKLQFSRDIWYARKDCNRIELVQTPVQVEGFGMQVAVRHRLLDRT